MNSDRSGADYTTAQIVLPELATLSKQLRDQLTGLESSHAIRLLQDQLRVPCERLLTLNKGVQAAFAPLQDQFRELLNRGNFTMPSPASAAIEDTVATLKNNLDSLANRISVCTNATHVVAELEVRMRPILALTAFTAETLDLLSSTTDDRSRTALTASLWLADNQSIAHTRLIEEFSETNVDVTTLPNRSSTNLRATAVQRRELLEAPSTLNDKSASSLALQSPAAECTALAQQIIHHVISCNQQNRLNGSCEDLFKPTNKTLAVAVDLPLMCPETCDEFGIFVDALYTLLYEGAGEDKLRFLDTQGGPLPQEEAALIFKIKWLRNKWFRHDCEHGDDKQISRNYRNLSDALGYFDCSALPCTPPQFRAIHRTILRRVNEFLGNLSAKYHGRQCGTAGGDLE